jgi:deoxyxylulose-5-phosphate synthase
VPGRYSFVNPDPYVDLNAAVINPHFVKPMDGDLITYRAEQTGQVITIEDSVSPKKNILTLNRSCVTSKKIRYA